MIPVILPTLPERSRVDRYLDRVYSSVRLTNFGPLHEELTKRLEDYLGVKRLLLVANGTLALQVAYRALGLSDSGRTALTTPFSFVATRSSLEWEAIAPVYADIQPESLNLDPDKYPAQPFDVVVPVHVFGNPCSPARTDESAERRGAKVVYDAAQAFGVALEGRSVLTYGDASTLSFHATKVFHTVEGGAIVFKDEDVFQRACEIVNFGLASDGRTIRRTGINAKLSEVHAAFGLAVLDEIDTVLAYRRELAECYEEYLPASLSRPCFAPSVSKNWAYQAILCADGRERTEIERRLWAIDVQCRRYFTPCLADTASLEHVPEARSAADCSLCLPLHGGLQEGTVKRICQEVAAAVESCRTGRGAA